MFTSSPPYLIFLYFTNTPLSSIYTYLEPIIFMSLLLLLSFFEVLSTSKIWNESIEGYLKKIIIPLLFFCFAITVFKIGKLLGFF